MKQNGSKRVQIFQAVIGILFILFGILHLFVSQLFVESMTALGIAWMLPIVGVVEMIGGVGLLVGLFINNISGLAALWTAATMFGAIMSHLRVGDFLGSLVPLIFMLPPIVLVYHHRQSFWKFLPSHQQA